MLEQELSRLYEGYGYRKFRMSKFEEYDLYARNKDFLKSGHIITFTDVDGSLKALKPDVTLSIIKNDRGEGGKVYYNENVYREMGGVFREILQVGVESVGDIDPYAEAEVLAMAVQSLQAFSQDYVLDVSHIGFLGGLLDGMGLEGADRTGVLGLLAEKNAPGVQSMVRQGALTGEQGEALRRLMEICAPLREGLAQAGALARGGAAAEALEQLSRTADVLEAFGLSDRVRLDFSLVNSLDYYNGVIFQGFLQGVPFAVLSGGRYDNLPRKMGKKVGAVGFALYMGLVERYFGGQRPQEADLLLTYGPDADLEGLAALTAELRGAGLRVLCRREGGRGPAVPCARQARYHTGMGREEVGV